MNGPLAESSQTESHARASLAVALDQLHGGFAVFRLAQKKNQLNSLMKIQIQEYIEFINEGHVETVIELKHDRNSEIVLDTDRIELGRTLKEGEKDDSKDKKPNRKHVKITYEPKDPGNLYEKIYLEQQYDNQKLGFISTLF